MTKRNVTFVTGAAVPPGTKMHLTKDQAGARAHLVRPVKDPHREGKDDRRIAYFGDKPVFFKAGEEIAIEGEIDRALASALGQTDALAAAASEQEAVNAKPDTAAIDAAREEGQKAGKEAAEREFGQKLEQSATERLRDIDAAREEGRMAGRAEMLHAVEERNIVFQAEDDAADALAEAERAHEAAEEGPARTAAAEALTAAQERLRAAEDAVKALPPLKA